MIGIIIFGITCAYTIYLTLHCKFENTMDYEVLWIDLALALTAACAIKWGL